MIDKAFCLLLVVNADTQSKSDVLLLILIGNRYYREKQIQGWSRKKKLALINGEFDKLPELSRNYTQQLL
ncbi:MAG: hypothetical protein JEZ14_08110 [Marinilabiliaceae bacterium]|nr:hypothetical protein [Marinilabiliaceae bacterium]